MHKIYPVSPFLDSEWKKLRNFEHACHKAILCNAKMVAVKQDKNLFFQIPVLTRSPSRLRSGLKKPFQQNPSDSSQSNKKIWHIWCIQVCKLFSISVLISSQLLYSGYPNTDHLNTRNFWILNFLKISIQLVYISLDYLISKLIICANLVNLVLFPSH